MCASSLAGQAERSQRGDQQRPAGARPERSRFDVVLKSARIASDLNQFFSFFALRAGVGASMAKGGLPWLRRAADGCSARGSPRDDDEECHLCSCGRELMGAPLRAAAQPHTSPCCVHAHTRSQEDDFTGTGTGKKPCSVSVRVVTGCAPPAPRQVLRPG